MASSLDNLGKNLSTTQKEYSMKYLQERFADKLNQEEIEAIVNKGKFPYSWFDSLKKLDYEGLPEAAAFHNDLINKGIKEDEYLEVKELFEKLGFTTFKEWLLLY